MKYFKHQPSSPSRQNAILKYILIALALISFSVEAASNTYVYLSGSYRLVIKELAGLTISFELTNTEDESLCSVSGVAESPPPEKILGSESESDGEGNSYDVDEYIASSASLGWLSFRIKSDDKTILILLSDDAFSKMHGGCDDFGRGHPFMLENVQ